jgi:hypothetical protein
VELSDDECKALVGCQEMSGNDLIPGCYEGGFKVWEGALDLVGYLLTTFRGPWQQVETIPRTFGTETGTSETFQQEGKSDSDKASACHSGQQQADPVSGAVSWSLSRELDHRAHFRLSTLRMEHVHEMARCPNGTFKVD